MVLKPVKNYRWTNHKCCANCKYWQWVADNYIPPYAVDPYSYGEYCCIRPNGPSGEWGSVEPEFRVCDRHKRK